MDKEGRLRRLQELRSRHRLDSLLITALPNIRSRCGFSCSAGALLVSERATVFFTDARYTSQARQEVQGSKIVIGRKAPLVAAAAWMARNSNRRRDLRRPVVGIEGEYLTVAGRKRLATVLTSGFRLREAPPLIEQARMVKDAEEIGRLRAAGLLGASVFEVARGSIRPGVRESEIAAEIEDAARRAGAQGMSFPTIIAAGARYAMPNGRASYTPISTEGIVFSVFCVL